MSASAVAASAPIDPPTSVAPPSTAVPPPIFAADMVGDDELGRAPLVRLMADLAAHPQAATPFLVAIHGSAGSGKSSFLARIGARLRSTSANGQILVVSIDTATGLDPATALVSGLFAALRATYPALAEEASHAGRDPIEASRLASDRVADLRRQLDTDRQALDEIGGRQARLVDTILFQTPGSQVDGYARANRGRIEGRLRAFGLPASDPVAAYKELVREAAETAGSGSRFGTTLRSLWAYKGQGTLIVLAVLLFGLGWFSTYLNDNPDLWSNWLAGFGDRLGGISAWAQAHAAWLMSISHAAFALGTLAVLLVIVRAFRFIQPVMRGVSLLDGDLDTRRRDIDGLLAHQTRRVDTLSAEIDAAVERADQAERRVATRRAAGLLDAAPVSASQDFGMPSSPKATADAFLASVEAATAGQGPEPSGPSHPGRIVVILDDFDALQAPAAAAYLDAAHRLLRRPGFVALAGFDRHHVVNGFSETDPSYGAAKLGRCVQLSCDLDAEAAAALSLGPVPDSRSEEGSALDRPWQDYESRLLRELSVFVGPNPRTTKRFANAYRVARADPRMAGASPAETAGLALALAANESGAGAELGAYERRAAHVSTGERSASDLDLIVSAAQTAVAQRFSAIEAHRGLLVARIYRPRG